MNIDLLKYLSGYISPARLALFEKVLHQRTNYITIVLEDIYQSHNASAVLRSCDCFGIQNIHIIENRNPFTANRDIAMGSTKWLTLNKYNQTENNSLEAIRRIKNMGYRIVATTPHIEDNQLTDFDLTKGKVALLFGSELTGISDVAMKEADEFLKIPMYGFTESFNISVSAAILLYHLTGKLRELENINWRLTENESDHLKLTWIRNTLKRSQLLEERFWYDKGQENN